MLQAFSRSLKTSDFIYCETCETYVDLFKFDSVEETGHGECAWRFVNPIELQVLSAECRAEGCLLGW
jgi:hypothetical protein